MNLKNDGVQDPLVFSDHSLARTKVHVRFFYFYVLCTTLNVMLYVWFCCVRERAPPKEKKQLHKALVASDSLEVNLYFQSEWTINAKLWIFNEMHKINYDQSGYVLFQEEEVEEADKGKN